MLDDINLNGASHGGNSSSDDEVVVGEDEELVACKNSNNGTSSSNPNPFDKAADGDSKNNESGVFRFETTDNKELLAGDRPRPEWAGWEKSSSAVGGSRVNPFEDYENAPPPSVETVAGPVSGGENGVCLFEEDVEFVGVEVEGTEKAMGVALKEGIVEEAGPLKTNKDNKIEEGRGAEKEEFNDTNYWKVDQEVKVLE